MEVPDECGLHFLVKLCMIKVYFMPSVGAAACGKERLTMNAEIRQKYELWLQNAVEDPDLVRELRDIEGQEDAIEDRFYRELEFGTGGLRGVIGAGENRMNIYTVRKATQGLADYLNGRYETAAVSVSFDSRIKSDLFAREAARVLAANGITVHLFPELEPTPVLSYAVRQNRCQAGIMVTASHNPAKYNGYKCYGPDGCQMTDHDASEVTAYIRKVDLFRGVKTVPFDEALADGRIVTIADALLESYMDCVLSRQVNAGVCGRARLSVVYTPLNGTGNKPVREVLRRIGVPLVAVVPEQELPDGNFPTAPYPNPEIRQAFECALELAKTVGPDLLLATDPDCDRVGIAVRDGEDYTLMTGNEVGCLLLDYILACRSASGTLPHDPVVVKTIVTSDLAARIAEKYGCRMVEVLTGFKYIGEQIGLLEKAGEEDRYVFGFEESYGYLAGTYVRDKDAVVSSMLICEMAAYYKEKGQTLLDVLAALYKEHGCYRHFQVSAQFEGAEGMAAMDRLMASLRQSRPSELAGLRVVKVADYQESVQEDVVSGARSPIDLPKSNVLAFGLEGGAGLVIRPSGTEPKVKVYILAQGRDQADCNQKVQQYAAWAETLRN